VYGTLHRLRSGIEIMVDGSKYIFDTILKTPEWCEMLRSQLLIYNIQ